MKLKKRKAIISDGVHNHTDPKDIDWDNKPENILKKIEWFRDLKLGFFIHYGLYTEGDVIESWPLSGRGDAWALKNDKYFESVFHGDHDKYAEWYKSLITKFNPQKFNASNVIDVVELMGAKYFNITTKHHDGFCLWDTKTTDFKITSSRSPYGKDIIKPLYKELQKRNIPIWMYFSKPDWNSENYWAKDHEIVDRNINYDISEYPDRWENYKDFVYKQVDELMSNYGKIDCLWLDGGWVNKANGQDIELHKIVNNARKKNNPDLLVADRTVGGEFEDFITPEGEVLDKFIKEPWETCMTLTKSWGATDNEEVKGTQWFVDNFLKIIAFGGNLLLGVGLKRDGVFDEMVMQNVREVGEWVKANEDNIFGTRPMAPYNSGKTYFLKKDNKAIIFAHKDDKQIKITDELAKGNVVSNNATVANNTLTLNTDKYSYNYTCVVIEL